MLFCSCNIIFINFSIFLTQNHHFQTIANKNLRFFLPFLPCFSLLQIPPTSLFVPNKQSIQTLHVSSSSSFPCFRFQTNTSLCILRSVLPTIRNRNIHRWKHPPICNKRMLRGLLHGHSILRLYHHQLLHEINQIRVHIPRKINRRLYNPRVLQHAEAV